MATVPLLQYTHSSASKFRRCPRAYRMAYVNGLRKLANKTGPLWFGSGFHRGLELLEVGTGLDEAICTVGKEMFGDGHWFDAEHEAKSLTAIVQVRELLRGYAAHYAASPAPIAKVVEKEFRIPILSEDGGETPWTLAGKIDLLFTDEIGRYCLIDHKTTAADISPDSDYWRRLMMDHQMSLYMYAARRLGYPVAGIYYNVIHKPTIKPRTKSGETLAAYGQRLAADIQADPAKYFARRYTTRTDAELSRFAVELFQHAGIVAGCVERGHFPRDTDACWMPFRCEYFGICSTGGWEPGDEVPGGFEIVENMHPELSEKEIDDE